MIGYVHQVSMLTESKSEEDNFVVQNSDVLSVKCKFKLSNTRVAWILAY